MGEGGRNTTLFMQLATSFVAVAVSVTAVVVVVMQLCKSCVAAASSAIMQFVCKCKYNRQFTETPTQAHTYSQAAYKSEFMADLITATDTADAPHRYATYNNNKRYINNNNYYYDSYVCHAISIIVCRP